MSPITKYRRTFKTSTAVLLQLVVITTLPASLAPASQARTGSASHTATASLVWREGKVVHIRGGTANSQLNVGVGLFANGIIDYNGRLVAGSGCSPSDSNRLSCGTSGSWTHVRGTLGPGNDTIGTIIPLAFSGVSGGYGRDTLYGSSYRDVFYGGPGNDVIDGGGGDDFLAGGPGTDTIDCGDGWDTADVDPYDRVTECEVRR